jgi:hypothetical protein
MQTAVDYIIEQLLKPTGEIDLQIILYHAKLIEKDQIIDAFITGSNYNRNSKNTKSDAESYYNFLYHKP